LASKAASEHSDFPRKTRPLTPGLPLYFRGKQTVLKGQTDSFEGVVIN
jgi:hypothetical protein